MAIALDSSNNAFLTGNTQSADFPVTSGAFDESYNNFNDAFVLKLSANGTSLAYASYLGGSSFDGSTDIAVASDGSAFVIGSTESSDFPTTGSAFDQTLGGDNDGFGARISADGSALSYATFLGGSSYDYANSGVLDSSNNVYVTGSTSSADFPTTSGAWSSTSSPRATSSA